MDDTKMGRIVHVNIPSTDLAAFQKFYGDVFGWTFVPNVPTYVLFDDRGGIGGGFTTESKPTTQGITFFLHVEGIPATLAKIESAGGKAVLQKTPIPGAGFFASFDDPSGNRVGVFSER